VASGLDGLKETGSRRIRVGGLVQEERPCDSTLHVPYLPGWAEHVGLERAAVEEQLGALSPTDDAFLITDAESSPLLASAERAD
jgi:hypothetical protein